ncbi:hypothetical protein ARHIZOSPH14_02590 [Agromyces rhizosphaerae]|uniref:Uncharacterized protein n=1 Tax=Agromyces rhizosphaerae TaxID=88374 RepID=A0A9W6CVI9_9MICO|nr:hypothetical protein [Agromyces rhizosphaerae]GLI26017.1 hypothetical protein ARHIZOSPH14_02590 [Agromyces rhizosphaerae]
MDRISKVVRLHLTSTWAYLALPWIILGSAFAITLAIWLILAASLPAEGGLAASDGTQYNGAMLSILISLLVAGVGAINFSFPFQLGFGVTRRDFWIGTSVLFVGLAACNAVLLALLAAIETWTNGWGLGGHLFTAVWFDAGTWLGTWFVFFAAQAYFMFTGALFGTFYMRWRMNGLVALWVAIGVLTVGAVGVLTWTQTWPDLGRWFVDLGPVGVAAWSLVPTAAFAGVSWLALRRATPKG